MKILNSYKDWPISRRRGFGLLPSDPGYYIEYLSYISYIVGLGINDFSIKTGFPPTHIIIGKDCRHEVEVQILATTWAEKEKCLTTRIEIFGLKVTWGMEDGIFLFFSPE